MAKKLGLGTASRQVLALMAAHDDVLLAREQKALDDIWSRLDAALPAARREVESGLRRARGDTKRFKSIAAVRTKVVLMHTAGLRKSSPVITRLAAYAVAQSLQSVHKELEICGATMAPRFANLAEVSARLAATTVDEIVGNAANAGADAITQTARKFQPDWTFQTFTALDSDELLARLFSPEVVAARGFNRRGIWWAGASDLQSTARVIATESANLIRASAMHTFNEIGKAHGG